MMRPIEAGRMWLPRLILLLGLALAYLPIPALAALLAFAFAGVIALRFPWIIWPIMGAGLPFAGAIHVGPVSSLDLLVMATLALWFVDGVRRRSLQLHWSPLSRLVLVYGAALSLALLQAHDLGEASKEVLKWGQLAAILLVARSMLTSRQAQWTVAAVLGGAALQAALGLYQFIFQIGPEWFIISGRFMRASGTFAQPNPFGGYLGLTLPVAVSLAIWAWSDGWLPAMRPDGPTTQADGVWAVGLRHLLVASYYLATAGIIGIGVVASWSRGGWLGAMAGVGVVVFFRNRKTLLVMAGLAVLLLGALLLGSFSTAIVPSPIAERVQDLPQYVGGGDVLQQPVTDDNFAVIERLAHWVAALRMWNQSPWVGVGPGNYAVVYPTVQMPRWDDPLGHAHNIYLNVLAESGLIGLSAFLTLWLGTAAWLMRRRRQTASNAWANAYALGLLGMLAHLTVHNIFDNLFVQGIYLHLGILLACLESSRNEHVPAN